MTKIFLILMCVIQVFFWDYAKPFKPELGVVPPLPSEQEVEALSFGDKELYFRLMGLRIQLSGDTFGRVTALKDYDYPQLLEWFRLFDRLDAKSNYIPSLAAYYFSRSQDRGDVVYVLDYLEEHSNRNPEANWWWLSQSIYLANSVLGDKQRALEIAKTLRAVETDIPAWARQMEVFLREDLGEKDQAEVIMCEIIKNSDSLEKADEGEMNFMLHFFEERLKTIKDKKPEEVIRRCHQLGVI